MSTPHPSIEDFLAALKADGRSSPEDWHRFHLFLKAQKLTGQKTPPGPLILAASGESDASKHRRLSDQLYWAHENGCLDVSLRYLRDVPVEQWNSSPPEKWFRDSYPS